jgi:TRAP-type C4-dicarboxylate transport system substrate-binding protein
MSLMAHRVHRAYVRAMNRAPTLVAALAMTGVATLAGCSLGEGGRVGGEPTPQPHVLTLLTLFDKESGLTEFTDEVSRLSNGRLEIRVVVPDHDGVDYEAAVIRDMQDGGADLAMVGARSWDEFGSLSLRALIAPLLVDSYALEARVLTSDVVDTMLEESPPSGLVGIGVLPGPIRRLLGTHAALASPDDFHGLTIGTQQSSVADATMRALGATPRRLPFDVTTFSGLGELDGLELQVAAIENARLDAVGSHLMTNVALWSRPIVVFASKASFVGLDDEERQVLRTAIRNVVPDKTAQLGTDEAELAANLCRKGRTTFDAATPGELQALRQAVEPVYTELRSDPATRSALHAIERLKQDLDEPRSEIPACVPEPGAASDGRVTEVDGVWSMDTGVEAAAPDYLDENWGHWIYVFDRGRFAITQENETSCTWGYGTYAVNGNQMAWSFLDGGGIAPNNATNRPGEYFVFDFSTYRDTLVLTPVEGQVSPNNFLAEPWRRLSETPTTVHLSTRCPPPPTALEP